MKPNVVRFVSNGFRLSDVQQGQNFDNGTCIIIHEFCNDWNIFQLFRIHSEKLQLRCYLSYTSVQPHCYVSEAVQQTQIKVSIFPGNGTGKAEQIIDLTAFVNDVVFIWLFSEVS